MSLCHFHNTWSIKSSKYIVFSTIWLDGYFAYKCPEWSKNVYTLLAGLASFQSWLQRSIFDESIFGKVGARAVEQEKLICYLYFHLKIKLLDNCLAPYDHCTGWLSNINCACLKIFEFFRFEEIPIILLKSVLQKSLHAFCM